MLSNVVYIKKKLAATANGLIMRGNEKEDEEKVVQDLGHNSFSRSNLVLVSFGKC